MYDVYVWRRWALAGGIALVVGILVILRSLSRPAPSRPSVDRDDQVTDGIATGRPDAHDSDAAVAVSVRSVVAARDGSTTSAVADKDSIATVMVAIGPDVASCYERVAAGLGVREHGTVVVEFTVVSRAGVGFVDRAEVLDVDIHPLFAACITDALTRTDFPVPPASAERVTVTYPFVVPPT
jgi:hypothetical protein